MSGLVTKQDDVKPEFEEACSIHRYEADKLSTETRVSPHTRHQKKTWSHCQLYPADHVTSLRLYRSDFFFFQELRWSVRVWTEFVPEEDGHTSTTLPKVEDADGPQIGIPYSKIHSFDTVHLLDTIRLHVFSSNSNPDGRDYFNLL